MEIKILQCGCPKSGNYGIHRILLNILEQNNLYNSYNERTGIAKLMRKLYSDNTTFDWGKVDNFVLVNGKIHVSFPSPECRFLPVDEDLFVKVSSLLWTHEKADIANHPALKPVTHRIYIIRDGRDVVNSAIHYSTRPEVQKLTPSYKYKTVEEVYDDHTVFAKYVRGWNDHVVSYLKNKSSFLCVRFEELITAPASIVEQVVDYLRLPVSFDIVLEQASFSKLAKASPSHMRKGKKSDWRNYFGSEHIRIFEEIAGNTLTELGYEKSKPKQNSE